MSKRLIFNLHVPDVTGIPTSHRDPNPGLLSLLYLFSTVQLECSIFLPT